MTIWRLIWRGLAYHWRMHLAVAAGTAADIPVMVDFGAITLDKTNDPVRMYLREMGTVPLLSREGEVEIAKRIEKAHLLHGTEQPR